MTRHRYPPQAVLLYVALGIALGMVAWALWLHDGGRNQAGGHQRPPALRQDNGR
jgi:hypothetical protein